MNHPTDRAQRHQEELDREQRTGRILAYLEFAAYIVIVCGCIGWIAASIWGGLPK